MINRDERNGATELDALFRSRALGIGRGVDGVLVDANDELLRIIGRDRDELAEGISGRGLTTARDVERAAASLADLDRDGATSYMRDLERPDGTSIPVLVAIVTTAGPGLRWIAVVVDLSRDERLRTLATAEAAIVATLLDDAPIGFTFISPDLRFLRVNREMAAMNGFSVAEHEGVAVFDLLPELRGTAEPVLRRVLETGEGLRDVEIVGETPAVPGEVRVWRESFFPVRVPDGPVMGVAAVARDETEVHRLRRELTATLARQRSALERLQTDLMPGRLPEHPSLGFAARYLSAAEEVRLGGDWFDIVHAADGRLVLSAGDAVGHGVEAVGLMARVSAAVRAYAWQGHGPAQILAHLDGLLRSPDSEGAASAVVVLLDPVTGELEYAGAGHPYPVLCTPGEAPRLLRGAQGPLLGFGGGRAYRSGTAHLAPGGALLLFTDGLVERRGEVLSTGLDRLLDAVGRAPTGAQEVLDAALARCLGDRAPEDDVCVLAVSRRA